MRLSRLGLVIGLLSASQLWPNQSVAQSQPGDAAFCQRYAAAAASAAQAAIAINPACFDASKGVHPNRQAHAEWCSRTAFEKVEGAASHIMRLASSCTQGAIASPTDYGGFDIAGANERFERPYGVAREWDVRAASSGGTFMYCVALSNRDGRDVRIGFDSTVLAGDGQWQVAVPIRSRKDWQGNFKVDGKGFGNGGGSQISGTSVAGWTIAWLSAGDVDGMRQGQGAVVDVGREDYFFSLEGAAAALLKVEECRQRKGVVAAARTAPPPQQQFAPAPAAPQPAIAQAAVTYGKVGDWTVEFVPARPSAGVQAQCRVTKLYGTENALRRVFGDKLTTIDFMGFGSHARGRSFDVTYRLNNDHAGGGRATMVADNDGVDWIRIDESEDGPGSIEGFQNSKSVTILAKTGGGRWDYALAGMKPAIDMAIKCLHERVYKTAAPQAERAQPAPPPAPRLAQSAPPPPEQRRPAPGKSFYVNTEGADVPGLCIDVAGGQLRQGTPIMLWQCHQQAPQRFGLNPNMGLVFVTAAKNLCVDGDKDQQLRLVDCAAARNQWRYDPRSNTIRSNKGTCWDIRAGNVADNIRQRAQVIAFQCHGKVNQQFVLND